MKAVLLFALFAAAAAAQQPGDWIQLFNGRDLTGWIPKIRGYPAGENFANTFVMRDGKLAVDLSGYPEFKERFGHLFWKDSYPYYTIAVEYRFIGEQAKADPVGIPQQRHYGARPNPGEHGQGPGLSDFDRSAIAWRQRQGSAAQRESLHAGHERRDGRQAHHEALRGVHFADVPWRSMGARRGDVLGSERIMHRVNGEKVLEYEQPQIGGGAVNGYDPAVKKDGTLLESGRFRCRARAIRSSSARWSCSISPAAWIEGEELQEYFVRISGRAAD